MIIAIIGTVGSGKSLSAVRQILKRDQKTFVNFSIKSKNTIRLKKEHIITDRIKGYKNTGEPITEKVINWEFWNDAVKKYDGFDIVLDEVHNIIHSRMSMSKNNVLMTIWFSQIRKILGTSEKNHIFLISQKLSRIDVAFRDLLDIVIYCKKEVRGDDVFIHQFTFNSDCVVDDYYFFKNNYNQAKRMRLYKRSVFKANSYFPYYDSYELIQFGDSSYI